MRVHRAVEFSDAERRVLDRASLAVGVGRSGEERADAERVVRSLVSDLTPACRDRVVRALGEVKEAMEVVRREGTFEHWREQAGPDWPNLRVQAMAEVIVRARQDYLADLVDAGHLLARATRIAAETPAEVTVFDDDEEGADYKSDRRGEKRRREPCTP